MQIRGIIINVLIISLLIITPGIKAQVLKDKITLGLLKKGVDDVYNMNFREADIICESINNSYPDHPVVLLLKGIISYWKYYPMMPSTPQSIEFESFLKKCIDRCDKYNKSDEAEFLLTNLCARGLLLVYYSDNNLSSKISSLSSNTYRFIRRSFNFTNTYPDFFYFTGLYNYYREAYPEAHPIYKPLAMLFPGGNKALGLKELEIASGNSIFLKAESASILAYISAYYENNMDLAADYGRALHQRYPLNLRYTMTYIRDLLLVKKYDEAENLINSMDSESPFNQAKISIFTGIIQEKKYHNFKAAAQAYNEGSNSLEEYGVYGYEYKAYAYYGLSRLSAIDNDKRNQKYYRKKAMELSDFKDINFDE